MHSSRTTSVIRKFAAGAFLAASVLGSAGAAHAAQPGAETVTMRFEFDRSDAAKRTYARLQRQAIRTCNASGRTVINRLDNGCVADLVGKAVDKMGDARVAQLHDQRTASFAQVASR